jgi:DNA-directed RNA polymerase subunit alpha
LPVDTVFAPVTSVVYYFETFENLDRNPSWDAIFEIKTNGSILPSLALITAIRVIQEMFKNLPTTVHNRPGTFESNFIENIKCKNDSTLLQQKGEFEDSSIDILKLSSRICKRLKEEGIFIISDLIKYSQTDLLNLKSVGPKSVVEISDSLFKVCGLHIQ